MEIARLEFVIMQSVPNAVRDQNGRVFIELAEKSEQTPNHWG